MLPKLRLAGLALRRSVTPVPESETVVGELLLASMATEILPVTLPVAVGAKVALKVALWPAVRVRGRESPLMLKPAPVTVASETVRRRVPLFLRVTVLVLLLPTVTFPKARLVGLALSSLLAAASLARQKTAVKRTTGKKRLAQRDAPQRLGRALR